MWQVWKLPTLQSCTRAFHGCTTPLVRAGPLEGLTNTDDNALSWRNLWVLPAGKGWTPCTQSPTCLTAGDVQPLSHAGLWKPSSFFSASQVGTCSQKCSRQTWPHLPALRISVRLHSSWLNCPSGRLRVSHTAFELKTQFLLWKGTDLSAGSFTCLR